jgi:MFS family permease
VRQILNAAGKHDTCTSTSVRICEKCPRLQRIALVQLYRASPLGVMGVTIWGLVTSAMFSMGSVYARLNGLAATEIATFMAVMILATVLTQLPIGRLSDRVDRRSVLVAVCVLAACMALGAAMFGQTFPEGALRARCGVRRYRADAVLFVALAHQ